MTNQNSITSLIEALTELVSISPATTESANRIAKSNAQNLVRESDLEPSTIEAICAVIAKAANPSGWYFDTNGIRAGLAALEELVEEVVAEVVEAIEPIKATVCATLTSVKAITSNAITMVVKIIKRTVGKVESMARQSGLYKRLKGFSLALTGKAIGRWKTNRTRRTAAAKTTFRNT